MYMSHPAYDHKRMVICLTTFLDMDYTIECLFRSETSSFGDT